MMMMTRASSRIESVYLSRVVDMYVSADDIPRVRNGFGIAILTTNKGLLTDKEARDASVGGEVLLLHLVIGGICHVLEISRLLFPQGVTIEVKDGIVTVTVKGKLTHCLDPSC